ncbi:MAG: helix-turn-helix domain-containing protein [Clostridiales bacterium]|nr:helix-turn-helix domain-containing protein [Clostridiales bacterium]
MREEILKQLKSITKEEQEILDGRQEINPSLYNLNRSMTVSRQKLAEHGRLIELRPHTRFIHFPKHTHNYVEIVYMCSGQTRHIVNGCEVLLKEGELLFMSQNAVQEIFPASEEDIAVNFIVLPEFFDQSLTMIGTESSLIRDFLIECLKNNQQNIGYLHFKVSDILPVQNLMENLIWMLLHHQPDSHHLDATTMGLVFLHLMHFTDKMDLGKDHLEQKLTLQVFRFIEENYREGELSDLAKQHHCNLYWLSRTIKSTTGKTYTELVQEKRLNQAAFLLTSTELSITDISLHVGYSNFSYFYRIFKKRYGSSPREFRRQSAHR